MYMYTSHSTQNPSFKSVQLSNAKSNPPAGAAEEHIPIRLLLQIRSKAEPAPLVLHICFDILLEGLIHGRRVMGRHRPRAVGTRIVPHGPHCKTLCERARVRARANKSETGQPCTTVTSSTHWNVGMRYCRHKTRDNHSRHGH